MYSWFIFVSDLIGQTQLIDLNDLIDSIELVDLVDLIHLLTLIDLSDLIDLESVRVFGPPISRARNFDKWHDFGFRG